MTRWMLAVALTLGLVGLAMLPGRAAAAEKEKVKMKLEDCPKAVQETLHRRGVQAWHAHRAGRRNL